MYHWTSADWCTAGPLLTDAHCTVHSTAAPLLIEVLLVLCWLMYCWSSAAWCTAGPLLAAAYCPATATSATGWCNVRYLYWNDLTYIFAEFSVNNWKVYYSALIYLVEIQENTSLCSFRRSDHEQIDHVDQWKRLKRSIRSRQSFKKIDREWIAPVDLLKISTMSKSIPPIFKKDLLEQFDLYHDQIDLSIFWSQKWMLWSKNPWSNSQPCYFGTCPF